MLKNMVVKSIITQKGISLVRDIKIFKLILMYDSKMNEASYILKFRVKGFLRSVISCGILTDCSGRLSYYLCDRLGNITGIRDLDCYVDNMKRRNTNGTYKEVSISLCTKHENVKLLFDIDPCKQKSIYISCKTPSIDS